MQDLAFIVIGLLGLYFGSEWLVTGASRTALHLKIPAVVIGLSVVGVRQSVVVEMV